MDFFDNALDKAKEAFDIVSKKTGEVVSVQKLKFNIATLENKCSKLYETLGKIYFEKLAGTETDDDVNGIVELIAQKEDEIAKLKAELNNLN